MKDRRDQSEENVPMLVVDDEEVIRSFLDECLSRKGYRVTTCESADEAIALAAETFFPVALVDIALPGMSGLELMPRLRALPGYEASVFVVMTGHSRPGILREALNADGDDFISKPFVPDLLDTRLSIACARHRQKGACVVAQQRVEELNAALERRVADTTDELERSEERYKTIFEETGAIMLVIHPETGRILDANPAACRFYGYDRETLEQMRIGDINTLAPDELREQLRTARDGDANAFFFRHRLASGEIRDVEVFSGPIRFDGEERLFSVVHDVTERRRTEEALRRSEELHRTTLSSISDAVLVTDDAGRFTYVCGNVRFLFGRSTDEVMDLGTVHALAPAIARTPDDLGPDGEITNMESTVSDVSGEERHVLVNVKRVSIMGGTLLYTCRDITGRRAALEALRQSEERLEMAVSASGIGLWDWDLRTDHVVFSEEWADLFGYRLDDLAPRVESWERLVHPEDMPGVRAVFDKCLDGRTDVYQHEYRMRHASGEWMWTVAIGRVTERDADGAPLRAVGIQQDVTARHLREEDLRRRIAEAERRRNTGRRDRLLDLVGTSDAMQTVYREIEEIAPLDTGVLLQGETGTGKELTARALHALSARRDGPFVPVNCGALPETLLESELFGHVKGAFTGATHDKRGLFAAAEGGTILLDEIEAASPYMQAALLRMLDRHEYMPVGGRDTLTADVRVVTASNTDLEKATATGHFREDLFFRIARRSILLPPLRERLDDLPALAGVFFEKHGARGAPPPFSPHALRLLRQYGWPGNVREFESVVARLAESFRGAVIRPADLPERIRRMHGDGPTMPTLAEQERTLVEKALLLANANKSEAARLLGVSRNTVYSLMKKHGIHTKNDGS